ncbi:EF-hand domain-containing protein [Lentibacter algarum]|uniref:EF-hand domain-containing protein n=1 Tax=Lentibacter algarum TaxID=576131 RepID=UPI001C08A119|nr:EF-hand domain-containing protein [Lentibacter algarum]MBU2982525.1 EF-hand domain-containing protein [Lentibacter algarum]
MKKLTLTFAALATVMTPALAMGESAVEVDANGDGLLTIEEVQAVYPSVTPESFAAMDANADGALDDAEIKAAEEAGMLTTDG